MAEAVIIAQRSGTIVYANAASQALFDGGSLVGRNLRELYPLELRLLRRMLNELRSHGMWRGELPLDGAAGRVDLAVALRSVAFAPGRAHHFCLVLRRRDASETSALSAVGRVAGEIAHDFNNQIAVVLNYSFILLRQLPDDSPLRAHVAEMQSAAWRASQVAQEMLGFGGQRRAECDEIDLNALLGDVKALFTYALREDTQLEERLGRNLWRVRARRAHLEWLLVELASRMRMTMGPLERFCIATSNSDAPAQAAPASSIGYPLHGSPSHGLPDSGSPVESESGAARSAGSAHAGGAAHDCGRSVVISVEAQPRKSSHGVGDTISVSRGMRGAELALAHARGELAVQQLPDGGMRYRIRLPAV
jgi:hypothetical protein